MTFSAKITVTVEVLHDEVREGKERKKGKRWRERRHDSFEDDRLHGQTQAVHWLPEDVCVKSEETELGNTNTTWARRPLAWSRLLM